MMAQVFFFASLACLFAGNIQSFAAADYVAVNQVAPYLAEIRFMGRHRCSGVVIDPITVLTAAQCLVKPNIRFLEVAVGKIGTNSETVHKVMSKHVHPEYDPYSGDYDAGILKVKTPMELDQYAMLINQPNTNLSNEPTIIVGWMGPQDGIQMETVGITNHRACKSAYRKVTNQMFCIEGGNELTNDPGAAVITSEGLQGIVSRPINAENQQGIKGAVCGRVPLYLNSFLEDAVLYGPVDQICAALKTVIGIISHKPFIPNFIVKALEYLAVLLKCKM